jgi:type I restriction enzyme S subunit
MMPNGWKKGVIEDIAKVSSGGTPSRQNDSYWLGGYIPWVTTAEVKFGVITDTEQKITEEGLKGSSAKLFPKDTILMAMYGQGKTRGQIAKLGIEASTNQACAALQLNDGFEVDYYYQYLVSQYENIRELANRGGQQNLSGGIIKGIHVPIPPLPEQRKIASILGTWDKAISTTERLIDNSKQQKKALMQQLLTAKKRLLDDSGNPFEGEWDSVAIGDVVELFNGFAFKSNDALETGCKWLKIANVGIGEIKWKDSSYLPEDYKNEYEKFSLKVGDIVVAMTRPTLGNQLKIARLKRKSDEALLNQRVAKVLFSDKVNSEYMYQLLSTIEVALKLNSALLGTDPPNLSAKVLHEIQMEMPPLVEQQRIAAVLTNADKEIERLVQQLADLKQEKKALMQQLLTGKRRVKIAKDAA